MPEIITSAQNNRVKQARLLLGSAKRRRNEDKIVLEGLRLIFDAIETGAMPDYLLLREEVNTSSDDWAMVLIQLAAKQTPILYVESGLFNELSDTQNSQGVLGVFATPSVPMPNDPNLLLIVDHVTDPGNLGTILRSAVAGGVDGVVMISGTVDPYNPKVVRSAMGAHFRMPIIRHTWEQITELGLPLLGADAGGESTIYDVDWREPIGLIIGGETYGLSEEAQSVATQLISIPMMGGESLNAAMATTVILFEAIRQRYFS